MFLKYIYNINYTESQKIAILKMAIVNNPNSTCSIIGNKLFIENSEYKLTEYVSLPNKINHEILNSYLLNLN